MPEIYTPGYSAPVLSFMGERRAETHAAFFLPRLQPGWSVLDAGCGPGAITLGLARAVAPGRVTGIDIEDAQFAAAREAAVREGLNLEFRQASLYELPFADHSFDAVFSHAVLTHLKDPLAALTELRRVLRPGGYAGIRASDIGGTLIDTTDEGTAGLEAYLEIQRRNSQDPNIGRRLGRLLREAGFIVEHVSASYENITGVIRKLGPALTERFLPPHLAGRPPAAEDDSMFVAIAWCEAIGHNPR